MNLKNVVVAFLLLVPSLIFAQPDTVKLGSKRQILVFPVIAKSIETGWSFGVASSTTFHLAKNDSITRTSNIQSLALYSLKRQFVAAINGSQYFKENKFILNEQVSFSTFPDKFWGIGKNTPDSAVENYSYNQCYVYLHLLREVGKNLYVGGLFEMQKLFNVDYQTGGLFDKENVAGRYGYFVAGLGMSFTYDNRNNAFSPDKGHFAQIYFNHFDKYLGSDIIYTNVVVDLRTYIRVYKKQVLALQAYSFNNFSDQVPIRSLGALGGSGSMRGYYSGRYRDNDLLVFQAEYRVPVYGRFGLVGFANTGDVGHTVSDYSLKDLKYSFGGGLRFALNKSEKLNLRLDYGTSFKGNNGLYFQLGEAF
ncbi:BamA/TamA family outer membrane protein [Chitinophagaceae bacterium LWZ2-11]